MYSLTILNWLSSICFFVEAALALERAEEILDIYENHKNKKQVYTQTFLSFDTTSQEESVIDKKLKEIDILKITPLEALNILDELKKEASNKKDV